MYMYVNLGWSLSFTCSSSLAEPLRSTSISRQRLRKSLNTDDSLSGFCSSGVPLVAIRYSAWKDIIRPWDNLQANCMAAKEVTSRVLWLIFVSHPEWILIQVGRLSFHHLYRHDSQRPDIHFGTIRLSSHHLWCHPVGRSHHRAALVLLWSDLSTEAKVGCRGKKKQ